MKVVCGSLAVQLKSVQEKLSAWDATSFIQKMTLKEAVNQLQG